MGNNSRKSKSINTEETLSERAQTILKRIVESYVRDGQPVGSRALAKAEGLDLSPATVRNVMADLNELGFITSPHTSAGRVPTVKGYRFFIDTLLNVDAPDPQDIGRLATELEHVDSMDGLIESTSNFLSNVTKMAGIVTVPRRDYAALQRIEFLPLAPQRVLAILVISSSEVQNCVLHTERSFSDSELQQCANYLNSILSGKTIQEIREQIIRELEQARDEMNTTMQNAIRMAREAFSGAVKEADFVVRGETNLLEFQELSNIEKLRALLEAFAEKRDILYLLDQCLTAEGIKIFVGEESGVHVFDDCSLITSPYKKDGNLIGVLGVIGPTRMDYQKVIPIVDITAKMITAALNKRHSPLD